CHAEASSSISARATWLVRSFNCFCVKVGSIWQQKLAASYWGRLRHVNKSDLAGRSSTACYMEGSPFSHRDLVPPYWRELFDISQVRLTSSVFSVVVGIFVVGFYCYRSRMKVLGSCKSRLCLVDNSQPDAFYVDDNSAQPHSALLCFCF
ncbi:hypothetical protein BX667DRAFT_521076, partial [Coemansia mojavensis]